MNIKNKNIWNLSVEEIDYVYNNLHMNNYIYAVLKTYHESKIPYNKIVSIKKSKLPYCIQEYAEKLANLTPYIGNTAPTVIRTNYTYFIHNFYKNLKYIKSDEINVILEFLSSIAYIPILADKNVNFPLWRFEVIRKIDKEEIFFFDMIKKDLNFNTLYKKCIKSNILKNQYYKKFLENPSPIKRMYIFIFLIQIIIIFSENCYDKKLIKEKWETIEYLMKKYEIENKLINNTNNSNILKKEQIRYQNCLYIYGGDFFRRIGDYSTAFQWYTKNIFHDNLPSLLDYFLTDMRICERLLCAYQITNSKKNKDKLNKLFLECIKIIFQNISWFSNTILNTLRVNHKNNLSSIHIYTKNALSRIYSGEHTRELFFLSLLYNKIINNIDYSKIDYTKYLHITNQYNNLKPINKIQLYKNFTEGIEHKFGPININYNLDEFIVICLVKDSEEYIENFIKHYLKLGAKHIFFIDNSSTYYTKKEIMKHNNVSIYSTNLCFKKNECEIRRNLINFLSLNRWCLCVDIDEFFDYPYSDKISMKDFLIYLNQNKYTAVISYMLDMFPKKAIKERKNNESTDFIKKYIYYDISNINKKNYPFNFKECNNNTILNKNIKFLSGGIRQKLFGKTYPFFLIKHPLLFINDKIKPFTHPHFCNNANIADITCLLKHYKFTNTFFKNINKKDYTKYYPEKSIEEYEKYNEYLHKNKKIKFYSNKSEKFQNIKELIDAGFIISSKKYIDYINQ